MLRIASAGSGVTSDALLAQVTGLGAAELAAAIRPAVAANVLVAHADGYAFRHALIQEAVHADLLPGEHSAVHTRFAQAIEAEPALVSRGPRGHREVPPLVLGAQHDRRADQRVARGRADLEPGGARRAPDAARPGPRAVGAGARRGDADRRRPGARARGGGGRRQGRRRAAARPGVRRTRADAVLDEATDPVRYALLLERRSTFRNDLGMGTRIEPTCGARSRWCPRPCRTPARTQLLLSVAPAASTTTPSSATGPRRRSTTPARTATRTRRHTLSPRWP